MTQTRIEKSNTKKYEITGIMKSRYNQDFYLVHCNTNQQENNTVLLDRREFDRAEFRVGDRISITKTTIFARDESHETQEEKCSN